MSPLNFKNSNPHNFEIDSCAIEVIDSLVKGGMSYDRAEALVKAIFIGGQTDGMDFGLKILDGVLSNKQ